MSLGYFPNIIKYNIATTPWTVPATARLTELWAAGKSVLCIRETLQAEFGIRVNKNSVIGKAHRLALGQHKNFGTGGRQRLDPIKMAERRAQRREYLQKWRAENRPKAYSEKYAKRGLAPTVEDYAIPTPQRKTIFELGPHDCRWPVGEPKSDLFFFCGAIAEEDRPYCSSHCRRAYVEIRAR
jgi:GcrA cell cycle regulator